MAIAKPPTKELKKRLTAAGVKPGEVFQYVVAKGCNTADGKRYEVGEPYNAGSHTDETTAELLDSGAIEIKAKEELV